MFRQDSLVDAASLVVKTPFTNISMIRGNQHLAIRNGPSPETTGLQQFVLDSLLDRMDAYDFVLIDCPPNLYGCSWNALLASDWVVIPVPPEDFGTQGLRAVHQAIENAAKGACVNIMTGETATSVMDLTSYDIRRGAGAVGRGSATIMTNCTIGVLNYHTGMGRRAGVTAYTVVGIVRDTTMACVMDTTD